MRRLHLLVEQPEEPFFKLSACFQGSVLVGLKRVLEPVEERGQLG